MRAMLLRFPTPAKSIARKRAPTRGRGDVIPRGVHCPLSPTLHRLDAVSRLPDIRQESAAVLARHSGISLQSKLWQCFGYVAR